MIPSAKFFSSARRKGVALVIVLAFVVLLTGLIVAYFSRSMTDRKLSNSSFNQSKVDVFAKSATDIIVGDLKQEIANGSNATTTGNVTIFTPTSPANMLPVRSGNPGSPPFTSANPDPIPNLVRRSVRNDTIPAPGVASRASEVNSTTDVSANGRSISLDRWNSHYLIPRVAGTTPSQTTPVANFTAPDWVYVTKQGPQIIAAPDPSVVGRYAFAIYDEGGLLDVNVAGYPSTSTANQTSAKTSLASANLTMTSNGSIGMSTSAVNDLVGWRNYASAQPAGTFGSFSGANATAYFSYANGNTNGFMKANNAVWNNRTDQMFLSRQELLSYQRSTGFSPDALQYLGTFTRGLEQPSFKPDPNRPRIVHPVNDDDNLPNNTPWTHPDIKNLLNNYCGGNDAYSKDSDPIPNEDRINPSFLDIRVISSFNRMDGSKAQSGEPLVKKRFPLNRLAWITHDGPSALASAETKTALLNAGVTQATIDSGTETNVRAAFGLTWCLTMQRWAYDHGFADSKGSVYIGKLDQVRDANREPDFFELLKASINAGSLGKAAAIGNAKYWNDTLGGGTYYQLRDKSLECQIYQIGVNLIDQADSDSYPTALWVNNPNRSDPACTSSTYDGATFSGTKFFGVEDLPYFNRMFFRAVVDSSDPPKPATGGSPVDYGSDPSSIVGSNFYPGSTVLLGQPEVWNPHDSSTWSRSAVRPAGFRISAVSEDPEGIVPVGSTAWTDFNFGMRFLMQAQAFYITSSGSSDLFKNRLNYKTPTDSGTNRPTTMTMSRLPPFAGNNTLGFTFTVNSTTGNATATPEATSPSGPFTERGYDFGAPPVHKDVVVNCGSYQAAAWPDDANKAVLVSSSNKTGNVIFNGLPYLLYGTEMTFSCPDQALFREPTLLGVNAQPSGSGLSVGPGNRLSLSKTNALIWSNYPKISGNYTGYVQDSSGNHYVGFVMARGTTRWIQVDASPSGGPVTYNYKVITGNYLAPTEPPFTVRLQYRDSAAGPWLTYDERFIDPGTDAFNNNNLALTSSGASGKAVSFNGSTFDYAGSSSALPANVFAARYNSYDPRSPRFGQPLTPCLNSGPYTFVSGATFPAPDTSTGIEPTIRPDNTTLYNAMAGIPGSSNNSTTSLASKGTSIGWFNLLYPTSNNSTVAFSSTCVRMGWLVENNPAAPSINSESAQYYADPDDIVRRASGAFAADSGYSSGQGIATWGSANQSRPVILNRPFRSVAEMSYAFRGSPWKNIDFSAPETGDAALLDVFCVSEAPANALVAGKFNLNTRQKPVLKAIISGAIKSELDGSTISSSDLDAVADAVLARTSGTNAWQGPLTNISELAGKLLPKGVSGIPSDSTIYSYTIPAGRKFGTATTDYAGTWSYTSLGAVMANAMAGTSSKKIQPFREAALRAMADTGQCRVWNLMIDVIAQTGRFQQSATSLSQFIVEGEKRYWLHVAIDRLTGQILDSQMEAVTE